MNPSISICCLSLLLLVNSAAAKPVSDLQSLKELLEEELNAAPFDSSEEEEMELQGKDGNAERSVFEAPEQQQQQQQQQLWDSDPSNSVLARLFKDLTRTSKRSWSRYKKGGLRSCFGVRLERIGSFSGLGC